MQFSSTGLPSQYGSWGLTEYTGQPAVHAPKYQALTAFLNDKRGITEPAAACFKVNFWREAVPSLPDGSFVGPPAITAPTAKDAWLVGQAVNIAWTVPAGKPAGRVQIVLWRGTNCGANAERAAVLRSSTANTGRVTVTLPQGLSAGGDYFLSIRSGNSMNFSEPFRVVVPYEYDTSAWSSCSAG